MVCKSYRSFDAVATILASEVIIGHKLRSDCARKSVRASSDSEGRKAFWRMYFWRYCYELFEKKLFSTLPKICGFIQKNVDVKLKKLETKFLYEQWWSWAWIYESNWKIELFYVGGKTAKNEFLGCFYTLWMFEGEIYPSHVHETSENCRTGFLLRLRTSTKFQVKILRGKKYGKFWPS